MASEDVTYTNTSETKSIESRIKYTYRDLPKNVIIHFNNICLDDELPSHLQNLIPPKTVGEWLKLTENSYDHSSPEEALAYFITDIEARKPSIIFVDVSCIGDYSWYGCHFRKTSDGFTKNVPGYPDYERQEINSESPMTDELFVAILASATRKRIGSEPYY